MKSTRIHWLVIFFISTIYLSLHSSIALSLIDAQTDIPVTTSVQPNLGESPMAIQEGTEFEFNFFMISRARILMHRLDGEGNPIATPIFEEIFELDPRDGDDTTHIEEIREISLYERAKYRISETYTLESAPNSPLLPPEPFFEATWAHNFDTPILDPGLYKLSIDALWHDIKAVASGDMTGEIQIDGEVPPRVNDVVIITAVEIPVGALIEATVTFDGKLDKTTELNSVWSVSNPQASPMVVDIGGGSANTLLSVQLNGDMKTSSVKTDLSTLNLDAQSPMHDDGTHGDKVSNDRIYSLLVAVPDSVSTGSKNLPVTVTDMDGNNFVTSISLEVIQNTSPEIIALNPDKANLGTSGLDIIVTGKKFAEGLSVEFSPSDIVVNSTTFEDSAQLKLNIDVPTTAATGGYLVTVTNPDGSSDTTSQPVFFVLDAPTITSVVPDEGKQGENVSVTIRGTDFLNPPAINFTSGDISVDSISFVDTTQIDATFNLSATAPGTYSFSIINPGGVETTNNATFTVLEILPTITILSPDSTSLGASGLDVIVMGKDFAEGLSVEFSPSDIAVNSVTFEDSTQLKLNINVPTTAATGGYLVTVTNPDGSSDTTSQPIFFVLDAPTMTSVVPDEGKQGESVSVTIRGTDFLNPPVINFTSGDISVDSLSFVDTTQIDATFNLSATAPGTYNFSIINPGGVETTNHATFTVLEIIPTITILSPDSAPLGAANLIVLIHGTNFVSDTTVSFSNPGITVNSVSLNSSTQIAVNISISDTTPSGFCDVTLTTPTGKNVTQVSAFSVLPHSVTASGVILFEERDDQAEVVALSLRQPGSFEVLETQNIQTDSDGNFSVSFSATSGEYDLIAKANGFLCSVAKNVTLPATGVEFIPSPLLGGDSNNDNMVTLADFALLSYSFGTAAGHELFNPNCDYNGDGTISIGDFDILAKNFSLMGVKAPALVYIDGDAIEKTAISQGEFKLRIPQSAFKIKPGDVFNVMIYAEDVIDLYSCILQVHFDERLFKLKSHTAHNTLVFVKGEKPGMLRIFSSVIGDNPGLNGTFTIITLQFQAIQANKPSSNITPQVDTAIALDQITTCDIQHKQSVYSSKRLRIRLIPLVNHLAQNYPNPFNPETWIPFQLSDDSDVTISIYNSIGRLVRTLKPGYLAAGYYLDKSHACHWDGKNESNEPVSNGVYFYHLRTKNFSAIHKMAILK